MEEVDALHQICAERWIGLPFGAGVLANCFGARDAATVRAVSLCIWLGAWKGRVTGPIVGL